MYLFIFSNLNSTSFLTKKSFEGIEGTVDIATICGTTGLSEAFLDTRRSLQGAPPLLRLKIGYIVQSIKVKSNMPLPVAP